jgi:serine/threonine protein kinase
MPIGIQARGGADWKAGVAPTRVDADATLRNIQSHLSRPGKANGVLTVVNRTSENREVQLKRKSGLQLLFRGNRNERLNDTAETIRNLLTKAGLDDAKNELDAYLAADPKRSGNRISAAKMLDLLNKHLPEQEAQEGSRLIPANQGSIDTDLMLEDMNRQSSSLDMSGTFEMMIRAGQQDAHDLQALQQQAPVKAPAQVQGQAQASQQMSAQHPQLYAGADRYPPKTTGRTVPDLLRNVNMQPGKLLGAGTFGEVQELSVQGQATMVIKTFKPGKEPVLSRSRNGNINEAIAAYLTSRKDGTYADRVNVVQPDYYLVEKNGTSMMLEPLALRAMLKDRSNVANGVRCVGLVMKKAEGQELLQLSSQLTLAQQKQVFKETVRSLRVLNERGFIHRDIKPENTFYDPATGKVSLIDTGLMHKRSNRVPDSATVSNLAGTASFMHPKIWKGAPYGTEADLYSASMMALELRSPLAMKLIERAYVVPTRDAYKQGRLGSGAPFFDKESLVDLIEGYIAILPTSGANADQLAQREELQEFVDELDDRDSYSSLIMDCLAAATAKPNAVNWSDTRQAAQIYSNILSSPQLN